MKNCILFLVVLFSAQLHAQTPAYFMLGESELDGLHIYGIHQDESLNYWIGTDNGLFKYDGYEFKNIPYNEMISPSLFGIISDHHGNIYCNNLSGQIFKITNDTCSLFYQIPDSLLSSIIEVSIDKYDRFFISSTVLFELLPDKSIKVLDQFDLNRALFYKDADEIVNGFGIQKSGSLEGFRITEDEYQVFPYDVHQMSPSPIEKISVFLDGDRTFLFEGLTGKIYRVEGREINEISQLTLNNNRSTIYSIMGEFWIPNITLGLNQINDIQFPNKQQTAIFDNFKISAYCIDNENNILFGTFKDGIIVVPKSQISSVDLGELNTKINLISLGANDEILFATHDGQFGKIDSEGQLIENYGQLHTSTIEFLEYLRYHDKYILGGLTTSIIDARSNEISNPKMGAMKNLVTVQHGQYIITTNVDTYIFNPNDTVYDPFKKTRDVVSTTSRHKIFSGRSYIAAFDSIHSHIYVGTSIGLKLIDSLGTYSLKFKSYDILCRDIMYCRGRIYVASDKNGVLIYENGVLIENWTIENRLVSNNTRKLLYNDDYIFINTDKGIQIVDYSGNTIYYLNKSEGLFTNHVIDMVVIHDHLIVLNQTGVQKIDLNVLQTNEFVPNIRFNSLKMNGKPISDVYTVGNYPYNENKFEADFGSISLKNRNEITYQYRLIGVENNWQTNSYLNHKVDYKTLPPGEYTFEVKAIWRHNESVPLHYTFKINSPFWTKWWFYFIIFIALFLTLFLVFYRQMKSQQRKSKLQEELYESKLIAIQAQMNPHFIFNSLNSIQDLVLKNDAENAYIYISKFAMLVRTTLTHSDKDFIDFTDEVKSLTLYLTLEKLRFKSAFEFSISAPEDIEVQIPPMLIQPFIENSLVHGLLHKSGQKKLSITFELADVIICKVTDNGIGRKEAKLIQERQFSDHESFAISAIKKRLVLLEFKLGGEYTVEYIDLEEDGVACGTQVIVRIPYLKDF